MSGDKQSNVQHTVQLPQAIFMVRPHAFAYNPQTASTNTFQEEAEVVGRREAARKARDEFDDFVRLLKRTGVDTLVFDEKEEGETPDAVFPNNWISTHPDGTVVLYPMMAPNRRLERRADIVQHLQADFQVSRVLDISDYEKADIFLEGTGSIVFDHGSGIAYANASPRTDAELFARLCRELDYQPMLFRAFDPQGQDIYHTNVLMNIGAGFVVVCLECIWEPERKGVEDMLSHSGLDVISIDMHQLQSFAGNAIHVGTADGRGCILMSSRAHASLRAEQLQALESHAPIAHSDLGAIETMGGGSARCMIAGIHLQRKAPQH
jgi:hypothetical protein